MRVNRGLLGWGVFFVVLGAVPLAVRNGLVTEAWVRSLWQLWPLVLVGAGLGLILSRTRFAIVGGLVVAVTFGLMGGAVIAAGFQGPGGVGGCGGGSDGERFPEHAGGFSGSAAVSFQVDCDTLEVRPGAGPEWRVAGISPDGRQPEVASTPDRLAVRTPDRPAIGILGGGARWEVTLPRDVATVIDLFVNAGRADLDLEGLDVPSISTSVNAGAARVDLASASVAGDLSASVNAGSLSVSLPPPATRIDVSASVNAGAMELCLAPGTPVRVELGGSPLGAHNLGDRGLQQDDDTWTTPGFDPGAPHVSIDLSVNLGSFTLDPEDGCD
jgi:hypothetical protein